MITYILGLILLLIVQTFIVFIYNYIVKIRKLTISEKVLENIPLIKNITTVIVLALSALKNIESLQYLFSYLFDIASTLSFLLLATEVFFKFVVSTGFLKKIINTLNSGNPHILLNNRIENSK